MKQPKKTPQPLSLFVGFVSGDITEFPIVGDEIIEIRRSGEILWTFDLGGVTNLVLTEPEGMPTKMNDA